MNAEVNLKKKKRGKTERGTATGKVKPVVNPVALSKIINPKTDYGRLSAVLRICEKCYGCHNIFSEQNFSKSMPALPSCLRMRPNVMFG